MPFSGDDEAFRGEIYYAELDEAWRGAFEAIEPVEAKNVGRIQGWRTTRNALESVLAAS